MPNSIYTMSDTELNLYDPKEIANLVEIEGLAHQPPIVRALVNAVNRLPDEEDNLVDQIENAREGFTEFLEEIADDLNEIRMVSERAKDDTNADAGFIIDLLYDLEGHINTTNEPELSRRIDRARELLEQINAYPAENEIDTLQKKIVDFDVDKYFPDED